MSDGCSKIAFATAVLAVWAHPSWAQAPLPGPQDPTAGDAARLYASACAPCHGRKGDGAGRGVRQLGTPQPRDFTAGVFEFRTTPTGSLPTDDDLYRAISRGIPGTWMPAWEKLLSSEQRWALVRYIKGFSEFFAEEEPDLPIQIPPEPGSSPELVEEGRFVYAVLKCWQCHGPSGRGDGPSADELTDDWDRKIRPYDFTRGHYKNGSDPSDIYRTLVTGLNGTPMPAFERGNLRYPGGGDADLASLREGVGDDGLRMLEAYLAGQPTAAELEGMDEAEMERLLEWRTWALVYYVRSLNRPRGVLYWLFGENPELQGKRPDDER